LLGEETLGSSPLETENSLFNHLGETNEVQSFIPSHMKRVSTLDVKIDDSLKVKRRTLVITSCDASSNSKDKIKAEDQVSSNQIMIREADDLETTVEPAKALKALEDGGQATVDELKVLNLGMKEDPRLIYVSTMLMPEEEKYYFHLLSEYRDAFTWSYKEKPGLDPKVAVHDLAIRKGISPKIQPQRRFRPQLIPEIKQEVNKLIDAGFIHEFKYPTWIANIVPVRKKNGQLRV